MEIKKSRRELLVTLLKGVASIATCAIMAPLLSCRKSPPPENKAEIVAKDDPPNKCPEQAMSEQEKSIRSSLKYVDQTPFTQRNCKNCKLYTLPVSGAECGGCKIVPGPIHPLGHCTAWIAQL